MAELAQQQHHSVAATDQPESQRRHPTRGVLIVLEGVDCSGKTTQAELLAKRLASTTSATCAPPDDDTPDGQQRRQVQTLRFPDRTTPTGKLINAYLRGEAKMEDHVIHLLFSANRWEAASHIHSLLNQGTTVVLDRYYLSGMVYSAAKENPAMPLRWCRQPEVGLPRPDIVLFLDLEEEVARSRNGWGEEVYEKLAMQKKVRELFWKLSVGDVAGARGGVDGGAYRQEHEDLVIVDASPSVQEVAEEIWRKVEPRVEAVERGELGRTVRIVQ